MRSPGWKNKPHKLLPDIAGNTIRNCYLKLNVTPKLAVMSAAQDFELPKDVIFPPGDLYSDEPPLESELHLTLFYYSEKIKYL